MDSISRRRLMTVLAGSALGVGASLASTQPAMAFSQDITTVRLRALHQNACGATASHRELVEEVNQTLGDMPLQERQAVIAKLTCPICGCPLAGLF
ncbi:hypothetical protein GALL_232430 [mine drainage metagenome]|uniref:Uncharacterized protein n=1 Tax=mine drainage metagenome TaxID=410659 RepID=A0A1J5RZ45_9ZZZZ